MGHRAWLGRLCLAFSCVACGAEEEDPYQYDRADVQGEFFGTWPGTWDPIEAGPARDFQLEIHSPDSAPLGSKCGNKALGGPGLRAQCISTASLAVSGTVTLADSGEQVDLDGSLAIPGLLLDDVTLSLSRESAPFSISAQWDEELGWVLCRITDPSGQTIAGCAIGERLP